METNYQQPDDLLQMDELHEPANYATFWVRFAAALIDGVILYIVNTGIGMATGISAVGLTLNDENFYQMLGISYALSTTIGLIYFASMESSQWQATLGKKAVSIKVTDLLGNRISFLRALGRYFSKIVSGLILLIGYIMAAFTEKKQALHDMMVGTLVIKA